MIAKHVKVITKDGMSSAEKEIRAAQHAREDDLVNCGKTQKIRMKL